MITPLYGSEGPMRVAGFMSGSGTNIVKLIEHELQHLGAYSIEVLFTDKPTKSKTEEIASKYKIPWLGLPYIGFFNELGLDHKDPNNTFLFYKRVHSMLRPFDVHAIALGGYMRIVPASFLGAFPLTVNVHPADLAIRNVNGGRRYTGDDAVSLVMADRLATIRSTTHLMTSEVDGGPLLLCSAPMQLDYGRTPAENQSSLKEAGDWKIFPLTLEMIATRRFARDETGLVHLDGTPIPDGKKLEEL